MLIRRIRFFAALLLLSVAAQAAWAQLGTTITIADYPPHGRALSPAQTAEMNRFAAAVVAVLNGGASINIGIVGHADFDPLGRQFENQVSRERAESAQATLQRLIDDQARQQAVPPARLQGLHFTPPVGLGTQRPMFAHPANEQERAGNRRVEITWTGTHAPLPPAPPAVTCVKPISGANPPRAQWAELEAYSAAPSMNPAITGLQPISAATGDINTDYFAVTIDAQGQTAAQLLPEYRQNFMHWISDGGSGQSIAPYSAADAAMWNSGNFKHAVMSFVLASLPVVGIQAETGAVVATCVSATDWVFSTVTTPKDGVHPVSGNRSFGVLDNHDGTLTLFTKGTDRVVDVFPYNAAGPTAFAQAEAFWRHFMGNVATQYAARHPRRTEVSLRRPYP